MADNTRHPSGLFLGLMSGTSLDGIDCAICKIDADKLSLIGSHLQPWPEAIRKRLVQLIETDSSIDELMQLHQLCATEFSHAALECLKIHKIKPSDVAAIGCHGQTVRHAPDQKPAYTLQIGNPALISELTGITTVSDFRNRDIAAGGQGAPLVPAFHRHLLPGAENTVILNIGGIANITVITPERTFGYDTGPGNRLLDDWYRLKMTGNHDRDGMFAASGSINGELLNKLLTDPYFARHAPKSTGTDYFNLAWLKRYLADTGSLKDADVQATLSELSAVTIAEQVRLSAAGAERLLICGGGWHNRDLVNRLESHLPGLQISSTAEIGVDPDWMEAMAFAWLASRCLNRQPGNLPEVTGATGERVLGSITYC
jgi:anhydro-N-acetylmuramic acid kinase